MKTLDTPENIKKIVTGNKVISIEALGISEERLDSLRKLDDVISVNINTMEQIQMVEVQCQNQIETMQKLVHLLEGEKIMRMTPREATLEDAYIQLIG
jgi:ABC-2 type transport system ATP-binding protein